MKYQGFIGPSYTLGSVNVDCQRCINFYPEANEVGTGKDAESASLQPTPGLLLFGTIGSGPIRCDYTSTKNTLFAVSGNKFYSVSSAGVGTELGTLSTSTGPVSIADNGLHVLFVDGSYGYTYEFATGTFEQITTSDFLGGSQVTFQDGYFIVNIPNTGQFQISGLNAVTWDPLDISTSEGSPDNLVGLISDHRDLWLFNEKTTEVFFNSGAADFPFERTQGAFIEHGCIAPFSIQKMNNSLFWLGGDDKGSGVVYMARGFQPQRISNHAVEISIQSYGDVSDAVAYTYQKNGHFFYVLNFSSANTTWVYDSSTGAWHERAYTIDGEFDRHRANCHAYAFSKHIVGDYENGNLYELSDTTYTDNSTTIRRRRAAPHISSSGNRLFYSSLQLYMETGVGIDGTGQGDNPQVMMEFSDDGGHSWSNEKWADIGRIGQTKARVMWSRLGSSRDRVFRVTISDPVKTVLIGAELEFESGSN